MQVIYAAPFILLSLIAFAFSLAVPRWRRYAFRALVAPVVFGFCSIVGMFLILIAAHGFNLQFANAPLIGARGIIEGIAIYIFPGVAGAWVAVEIVRQIEIRILNTQTKRDIAIRAVIALIVFGPVFVACTGIEFSIFSKAEQWWPVFLAISFLAALFVAIVTFLVVRTFQQRDHARQPE